MKTSREVLITLMGVRLADRLIAQLHMAGFEISPIAPKSGDARVAGTPK